MFKPKTEKVKKIADENQRAIEQIEELFGSSTRIYIDYANVRPWSTKLNWHIDLRRLKQFLDSFDTIEAINFYGGYVENDEQSEKEIADVENLKYVVRDFSDPVKRLLEAGRKVVIFATARKVSKELSELREKGLVIFDIQKIRNFICWNKEIQSKGDLVAEAPKQ